MIGDSVNADRVPDYFDSGRYKLPRLPYDTTGRVWLMHALHAKDQLRQRVAWALAQTFVVSANHRFPSNAELFLNYYDIFLRNAFGDFRQLLREVTHSPIMAEYLTFYKNNARDVTGRYPDENYAREIMQLFTIGLWVLEEDGSKRLDAEGNEIPTYTNEHIMDFARVFTGLTQQPQRSNYEENKNFKNPYDPMKMARCVPQARPQRRAPR